jgi:ATP adenylyltransferase
LERLWAPWRLDYVTGSSENKSEPGAAGACLFCDKPEAGVDAANLILTRGRTCFVILNAFPYNNGHLMVVPYRHLSHPGDLTPEENAEMMQTVSALTRPLERVYRPDGFNIGMNVGSAAGAGIAAHLHLHVVPRWGGDTNFISVIGDVKVLPELLAQTYQKLKTALEGEAMESARPAES